MIDNEILFKCYNLYTIDNLTIDTFKHAVGNVYNMSDSTLKRRLSTVRSWFKWLSRIIELNKKNVNYDITEVGLIEQVKSIVSESNSKNIRMFILKERLNESLEYGLDDRELMRKINKSDMYFSEELQILFETKDDYYNYLK
jgi:site-specific recombinase XerD